MTNPFSLRGWGAISSLWLASNCGGQASLGSGAAGGMSAIGGAAESTGGAGGMSSGSGGSSAYIGVGGSIYVAIAGSTSTLPVTSPPTGVDGAYACTPTHFRNASCTVLGANQPWNLDVTNSDNWQGIGLFTCSGEWSIPYFVCTYVDVNANNCTLYGVIVADGLDVIFDSSGTSAHCVPQ